MTFMTSCLHTTVSSCTPPAQVLASFVISCCFFLALINHLVEKIYPEEVARRPTLGDEFAFYMIRSICAKSSTARFTWLCHAVQFELYKKKLGFYKVAELKKLVPKARKGEFREMNFLLMKEDEKNKALSMRFLFVVLPDNKPEKKTDEGDSSAEEEEKEQEEEGEHAEEEDEEERQEDEEHERDHEDEGEGEGGEEGDSDDGDDPTYKADDSDDREQMNWTDEETRKSDSEEDDGIKNEEEEEYHRENDSDSGRDASGSSGEEED
jgi:hypothetical protein